MKRLTQKRANYCTARTICLALPVWLGAIGATSVVHADQPDGLANILASIDRSEPTTEEAAASLQQLQRALDVNKDVAAALLRAIQGADIGSDRRAGDLAQSAATYHAVMDALADTKPEHPDEQEMVKRAEAAMAGGRFDEAAAQLRRLEEHEIGASASGDGAHGSPRWLAAAKTQTLLGKIALMQLDLDGASKHFEAARDQIAKIIPGQSPIAVTEPLVALGAPASAASSGEQSSVSLPPRDRGASKPIDGPAQATRKGASPAAAPEPIIPVIAPPAAVVPSAPPETPKSTAESLSPDMVGLLLRRGDELLGLGDLVSARLLFERAAAAGEPRGAIGAAKTYDPQVLSQLGVRGIRPDPATAASWYRKALELGDRSAAEHLTALESARSQ